MDVYSKRASEKNKDLSKNICHDITRLKISLLTEEDGIILHSLISDLRIDTL